MGHSQPGNITKVSFHSETVIGKAQEIRWMQKFTAYSDLADARMNGRSRDDVLLV